MSHLQKKFGGQYADDKKIIAKLEIIAILQEN